VSRAIDALARTHGERAIEIIAQIMNDPFAEDRDKIKAADSMLDRGHGKPLVATIALPSNRAHQAVLAAMSDEELMARIQGAALPRLAPIEVTCSEVDDLLA
jgi:class 3 adenylate cyclase